MKRIFIYIACITILASSCKKTLNKEFNNPEIYSNTGNLFAGMFSKTLYSWKLYIQDYGEWWWELQGSGSMGVAGYSQISQRYITDRYAWFSLYDDLSGTNGFGSDNQLWNNRLGAFYGSVNTWAVIKDNIANVTGKDLDDNNIYYALTTVMKDYAALQAVDFYNSIPYSEAFKGKDRVFFPKYDDPKEIYKSVLDELKVLSETLPGIESKMSASAKAVFQNQDIAFKGDVQKWVQYINAMRLKYAVRISGVEEAYAKTIIADVLSKNNLPTTDQTWAMPEPNDINGGGGYWNRGVLEGWPATFIPNIIMKRLNRNNPAYEPGIDDPRLPVIALPTRYSNFLSNPQIGDYRGVSMDADGQKPAYVAGERYYTGGPTGDIKQHFAQNSRSMYNFATYSRNDRSENYMSSLAETDLLLAEVAAKGLGTTPKTASEYIKDAVVHSTDFWYRVNNLGSSYRTEPLMHPTKPSSSIINTYADSIKVRFETRATLDDKMELLMQQKYLHLNLMCPYELWAEVRRTRHPKLEPMTFATKVMKPFPERLRYPTSEQQTNPDNYNTVKASDNFTSHIFWVPPALRTVVPYWNNYNYE